jgi:hypothetical protein
MLTALVFLPAVLHLRSRRRMQTVPSLSTEQTPNVSEPLAA